MKFSLVIPNSGKDTRPLIGVEDNNILVLYQVGTGKDTKEVHPKINNAPLPNNFDLIEANGEYGPLKLNSVEVEALAALSKLLELLPEGSQKEIVKKAHARLTAACTADEQSAPPSQAIPPLYSNWKP
jgi:hypothetical protein